MAKYTYRFEGKTFNSAPMQFVIAVTNYNPELKHRYENANELSYPNKKGQRFYYQLARRMERELSREGWDISIAATDDSRENDIDDDVRPEGDTRWKFQKQRVNQAIFRKEILSAYDNKCCITGINIKELLVASHIKPWNFSHPCEKTDPRNGLCLNALHDRAFDRGLIAIADDFTVMVSRAISSYKHKGNKVIAEMLLAYEGEEIKLPPDRSKPLIDLLSWHRNNVFKD